MRNSENSAEQRNLVIAISGSSGFLYAKHFLKSVAANITGKSSLIISPAAFRVALAEEQLTFSNAEQYLSHCLDGIESIHEFRIQDHTDIAARAASGSTPSDGMVIIPCSMKTVAGIAHGYTTNLIERAADVTLKERRRLIVVVRESPYSLVHLKNMTALTEAGGIVVPASPGFYQNPQTFADLGQFMAGRVFALLGLDHNLFKGWDGICG